MENQEKNETTVLPENPEIMVKNPRIGKVRKLEEEVRRQNELEQLRTIGCTASVRTSCRE